MIYFGRCICSLVTQLNLILCLFDFIPQYAFCTILVLSFWSTYRFHKIMANKETFIIFQHINTLEKYASQTMARWFVANRQAVRLFSIFARQLSPQQAAVGSSLTTNINQKARDIMRVALIQISDMHCLGYAHESKSNRIDKAIDAIRTLDSFDHAVLLCSGDLADHAYPNEYRSARGVLGRFLSVLGTELDQFVPLIVVPGNHDIALSPKGRGITDIQSWIKADHINEELQQMKDFFVYADSKNCFKGNHLYDAKDFDYGDMKISFCMLNSAPFSTLSHDDKEAHFFPGEAEAVLRRTPGCDFMITIMHHSHEHFEWNSRQMLQKALYRNDLVFYGHDHVSEGLSITSDNGTHSNIIKGGKFSLRPDDDDCSFNTVILDSETDYMNLYEFVWHKDSEIFSKEKEMKIPRFRSTIQPTREYLDKLLSDRSGLSEHFTAYYVFPKLVPDGGLFQDNSTIPEALDADALFDAVSKAKIISISGPSNAGKTSLLKYLYAESVKKGFFPLYLEQKDYRDSKIEKMFQGLYEDQYGESPDGFESYMQKSFSKRIIFVDNIDMIKSEKARENLMNYIISKGGLLIYSTKEPLHVDLIDVVKGRIRDEELGSLEIVPFYKGKRDELIESICQLPRINQSDRVSNVTTILDYVVQCQASFVSLQPGALIPYIQFYAQNSDDDKGTKSLTIVFETNIRQAMITYAKDKINPYLSALETIAHEMYFEWRTTKISIAYIEKAIIEYNKTHLIDIEVKPFVSVCKNAGIFVESESAYDISFRDNNTYAYFVAKYINREIERNANRDINKRDSHYLDDITYVMNHICFGINRTIILFLSYIRSNTRIIIEIASKASELLVDYPELSFDENNIPFISCTVAKPACIPSHEEREEATREVEKIEKQRHDVIEFRDIFDFNEEDVNKEKYKVLRALCYVRLLGRMLVDQYGNLEAEDLDVMLKILYEAPQKILYAALKPYQEHYDEIISDLEKYVAEVAPDERISRADLQNMLSSAATTLSLNVMNDIAYNSANRNTIGVLDRVPLPNSNHEIHNLMMCENVGNSDVFVERAHALREKYKDDPFICYMISRIAQKHLFYKPKVDKRVTDKMISYKLLSRKAKKMALVEQQKEKFQK